MYLVVILATFMSAIYGYNLSARPDYDRDIPRKKAMAVISRFVFQHSFAADLLRRVKNKDEPGHEEPLYILPGDVLHADTADNAESNYTMVYDQTHPSANDGDGRKFVLRELSSSSGTDYMQIGRKLLNGDEMASKVICLKRLMTCDASNSGHELCKDKNGVGGVASMCEIETDEYDSSIIEDTCCRVSKAFGGIYLVSFMKLDARWKGRISGTLSYDFWRAVEARGFNENIGVINWEDGAWQFRGKMHFSSSYKIDLYDWLEIHPDIENNPFPLHRMFKTHWTLPVAIFDRDFFKVNGVDYCETGCLFRIKTFM